MVLLQLVLFCIYGISAGPILKGKPGKPLKCPKSVYYAMAESKEPFTINAQHPNNPADTEYEWEIVSSSDIDLNQLLVDGEDTDTFWITQYTNAQQYGELKLKLTLSHEDHFTTPCSVKLVYQPLPYFGIDLGTTFSCIAYQFPDINPQTNKREIKWITADTSSKRQYCIPTAVYFPSNKKDKLLVGYEAREKLKSDPENVIFDVKRIIGRKWNDPEVQAFASNHPFKITTTDQENIKIVIKNRDIKIAPEQALAVILKHLIQTAMKEVNIVTEDAVNVVISIPAFFHNGQRRAVQSAAKLANLDAKLLVVEPTAAAIAHIYYATVPENDLKLFLGTLDCSVMRCMGMECDVLGVAGNSTLGGIDYDHVIKEIIIKKLVDKYKIDPKKIDEGKLSEDSEMIKISLSTNTQHDYKYGNYKDKIVITRKEFENHPRTQKLINSAIKIAKSAMEDNPKLFKPSNIRMILMIGGSSNIPIIQRKIKETFSRDTLNVQKPEIDPQLMVITGSAVLAGSMVYDRTCTVTDVIPLPLGFEVCYGTYGKNANCGNMDVIIEKNTQYPVEVNKTYCQHDPKGTWVGLKLYEGENPKVVDNHFISSLDVRNLIPRDPKICNSYHAVFKIDKNGIVTIQGVAHKADGSDGDVYTMTLSLNTDDGSLSQTQLTQMKTELESWFNLNVNQYKECKDEL